MSNARLSVRGIAIEKSSKLPILFLTNHATFQTLAIPIGPAEANSIILQMEGVLPPRPMTHDLVATLFHRHGLRAQSLDLYGYCDEELLACIRYSHGLRTYTMEVRPSDGIALAVRLDIPIVASEEVLARQVQLGGRSEDAEYETSEFLYLEPDPFENPGPLNATTDH